MKSGFKIIIKNLGYYSCSINGESLKEKWDIRELNLKLFSFDRVRFIFQNYDQKEVLLRLLLKKLKPKTGSIIIPSKIKIYSANDFWNGTDKKLSINQNLESKLFSHRPWFGGRRKNLVTLIYRLGLGGKIKHIPVSCLSADQRNRFAILMMVAAKTKVIIIENLFLNLDEISFLFFKEWIDTFSGIMIYLGDLENQIKHNDKIKNLDKNQITSIFSKTVCISSDGFSRSTWGN